MYVQVEFFGTKGSGETILKLNHVIFPLRCFENSDQADNADISFDYKVMKNQLFDAQISGFPYFLLLSLQLPESFDEVQLLSADLPLFF